MNMMRRPRKLKRIFSASETIAFSKWNYPITSTLRQEAGVKKTSYPQGADVELLDDFYSQMWSKRAKWIDPTNTFCTSIFFFWLYLLSSVYSIHLFILLGGAWGKKKFSSPYSRYPSFLPPARSRLSPSHART